MQEQETGYRALLTRRKNRTLAILLGEKEDLIDPHLPEDIAQELRKMILDYFNDYHDNAVDVIESMSDGMIFNELVLEKLKDALLE